MTFLKLCWMDLDMFGHLTPEQDSSPTRRIDFVISASTRSPQRYPEISPEHFFGVFLAIILPSVVYQYTQSYSKMLSKLSKLLSTRLTLIIPSILVFIRPCRSMWSKSWRQKQVVSSLLGTL
ncbi:hypothetical protein J3E68DRAFT_283095 [Trichoderma sp. SZMC 28012]